MHLYRQILAFLLLICWISLSDGCNEALCVSIVSKCMLIKSCDCDMTNMAKCSCCKNCTACLSTLYTECCSCVGMCPVPDPEEGLLLTSTIEDLKTPIPELFQVLTEEKDEAERWTTYTYPAHYDALYFKPGHGMLDVNFGAAEKDHNKKSVLLNGQKDDNCTVAFMVECLSLKRCKLSCQSMGAARYRWFHEHGCCQCIGSTCINYGINKPKCSGCTDEIEEIVVDDSVTEIKNIKETVDMDEDSMDIIDETDNELDDEEIDEFDIKRV